MQPNLLRYCNFCLALSLLLVVKYPAPVQSIVTAIKNLHKIEQTFCQEQSQVDIDNKKVTMVQLTIE